MPKEHLEGDYKLGNWVGNLRQRKHLLSLKEIDQLNKVNFIWSPHILDWEIGLEALKDYVLREGNAKVPQNHKEGIFNLGSWVATQRTKINTLSSQKTKQLNKLYFIWDTYSEEWEAAFNALETFKEREGHLSVPARHKENGFNLGSWVSNRRSTKSLSYPQKYKDKLNKMGFVWNANYEAWMQGYNQLLSFYKREGNINLPHKHKENGYDLSKWVFHQRANYKTLSVEQKKYLDDLNFSWNPNERKWEKGFKRLQEYKKRQGHCRVPRKYIIDGVNLYNWVASQRRRKGKLPHEKIEKLDALGFDWGNIKKL